MNLISINTAVSQASMEIGIAQAPITNVLTSTDQDVIQMYALLSAVADELLLCDPYQTQLSDGVWLMDSLGNKKTAGFVGTDLVLFDPRLVVDGLKFRFLKAKGLEFGEELRDFTNRLNKLATRINATVIDLYLDEGRQL